MITAAFVDLMRTDELLAQLGPERFAAALDERISRIQEVAAQARGAVQRHRRLEGSGQGAADRRRPVEHRSRRGAVLRMAREIMDRPGEIPMRDGRRHGPGVHRRLRPALPPHLRRPGRRDQPRCPRDGAGRGRPDPRDGGGPAALAHDVRDHSDEPFHAKGKAEPVRASIVGPIVGPPRRRQRRDPVRRPEPELDTLPAVLADVRGGTRLDGRRSPARPASGKSRLVGELLAAPAAARAARRVRGVRVLDAVLRLAGPAREVLGLDRGAACRTRRSAGSRGRRAGPSPGLVPWLPLLGILLGLDLPPASGRARPAVPARGAGRATLRFLVATLEAAPVALSSRTLSSWTTRAPTSCTGSPARPARCRTR